MSFSPQSTGILAGRRDLLRAVALNASPNQALARAAKTSKKEVADIPGLRVVVVQQGAHQGGYADEIAIDAINLQPGDDIIIATRLREELTRG